MGAPKYNKKRDASESDLVLDLRARGVSVHLTDRPGDCLLGFLGRTDIGEFKTPKTHYGKKLNDNQAAFQEVWKGSDIVIFRTVQDTENWVKKRRNAFTQTTDNASILSGKEAAPTTSIPNHSVLHGDTHD